VRNVDQVLISPSASQLPGLIPDFLQQWVVLNDDGVLDEAALRRGAGVAVVDARHHAAAPQRDVERGLKREIRIGLKSILGVDKGHCKSIFFGKKGGVAPPPPPNPTFAIQRGVSRLYAGTRGRAEGAFHTRVP